MLRTSLESLRSLSRREICSPRCLTMFQNETTNKFSRELALEYLILQLNPNPEKGHYFDLRTEQNQYYCGCRRTPSRVRRDEDSFAFIRLILSLKKYDIAYSSQHARNAYTQIRQALLAYNNEGNEIKSVFTSVTSKSQSQDITELYKINPIEVLGSGQFGTVYGGESRLSSLSRRRSSSSGHSLETNEQVAIKVIDKSRFTEQEEKIHREVDILHEITHPGVIKLYAMFDTPGKVSAFCKLVPSS